MIIVLIVIGVDFKDFLVELKYIKAFSNDELHEKIDKCQCLAHIEAAIDRLLSGTLDQIVERNQDSFYFLQGNTQKSESEGVPLTRLSSNISLENFDEEACFS